MNPLEPGDRLERYSLDALIARGGMASVFRATDTETGAQVAIKVPHPQAECDPVFFERFRREAAIGREMDHPGLMKVMPAVKSRRVFMAAEWIEGRSLRQILETEGRLTASRAIAIALAVCEALEYLHAHGVAHRDLKPENIIVDGVAGIKLIDFGIAARSGLRRLTFGKLSLLMGTADYISPEQLKGKRGDARGDLYALGVILYEMIAGVAPFEGQNPFLVMNRRLAADADMSPIPEDLRAIVRCAMKRDPARRYARAADLAADLASPQPARHAARCAEQPEPPKAWLLSLAVIPATIFLLLLYVARHQ